MKTNSQSRIALVAALLCAPLLGAHAQETMAGMGAAGAMGATLGAIGAGGMSASRATRGVGNGPNGGLDTSDPTQNGGGFNGGGRGASGAAAPATRAAAPFEPQNFGTSGESYVSELMGARGPSVPTVGRHRRSARAQSIYATRLSRQGRRARSRSVNAKYRIPPVGWKAAYLPQDRYKLGTMWKYVSTEDTNFYFTPQDLAARRFNPNRVIGFYSYQDALLAGYRPDPASKPAPGAQIAQLARLYRGPELYTFVEYVYAGQISPESLAGTTNYAQSVYQALVRTRARPYIGATVAKVLEASVTGDSSIIPRNFNSQGPITMQVANTGRGGFPPGMMGGPGMTSNGPMMGGAPQTSGAPDASGTGDKRTDDFNAFGNRAGKLANVPGNN